MTITWPERRYLNFSELILRWKCEESDIREAIVLGALVPSYFFCANIGPGNWVESECSDEPGSLEFEGCLADFPPHSVNGFFFLRHPIETGVNDCLFNLMCESPTAHPSLEGTPPHWYRIPNGGLTLAEVESRGVFLMSEVLGFEARQGNSVEQKDAFSESERKSVLLMLYAMAVQKYRYNPSDQRSQTVSGIQAAIEHLGEKLTDKTIKRYLDEAADRFWNPRS